MDPLINKSGSFSSVEEIKDLLQKVSDTVIKLEKYNGSIQDGRSLIKTNRNDTREMMGQVARNLKRARELIDNYAGPDAPIYRRKLANWTDIVENVIATIREKEERDLGDIRRSVARVSFSEESDEYKQHGKLIATNHI